MKSFLFLLFLTAISSLAQANEAFWEFAYSHDKMPPNKKKEYAAKSKDAFRTFVKNEKLTPENLSFIQTQASLFECDFEQDIWFNPHLDYDALVRISPKSAVLDTALRINSGLRKGEDEAFFVNLFASPKLKIQEKIRLLGYFRRNGGVFSIDSQKKLWNFSEGNEVFKMFLCSDFEGEITNEYFDFLRTKKEVRYLIAERGSFEQIHRLYCEIGSKNFWSNAALVRSLLTRSEDFDIDSFLNEDDLVAVFSDKIRGRSCLELFLSGYNFTSGKINPKKLLPFVKYIRERQAIAFNPTLPESLRIPFFESLRFSEVFFQEKSSFSREAQEQIIRGKNLESILILLMCNDFDWSLFPKIDYSTEELKYSILLNPNVPRYLYARLWESPWKEEELRLLLEKSTWKDLPIEIFPYLYKNIRGDVSMLKLLLLSRNLPEDYRKKIFDDLEGDPELFSFVDETVDLSQARLEELCEKQLRVETQSK